MNLVEICRLTFGYASFHGTSFCSLGDKVRRDIEREGRIDTTFSLSIYLMHFVQRTNENNTYLNNTEILFVLLLYCVQNVFKGALSSGSDGDITSSSVLLQMSEKSGTNGNVNYFSYFYLQVKVKG
jgi:hypothetical protein